MAIKLQIYSDARGPVVRFIHSNLISRYGDSGTADREGETLHYVVTEFLHVETLHDYIQRKGMVDVEEAVQIVSGLLHAVRDLYESTEAPVHGNIRPANVMLCSDAGRPRVMLSGFSQTAPSGCSWDKVALLRCHPLYAAPERREGKADIRSDIFSAGAVLFKLLMGMSPWSIDLSNVPPSERLEAVERARREPLRFPCLSLRVIGQNLLKTTLKALTPDPAKRFATPTEMLDALEGRTKVDMPDIEVAEPTKTTSPTPRHGNGFADVAGMDELKQLLQEKIVRILRNPKEAKRVGANIPNGMLLYGPPGCGKSFIVEKFAEEAGYNYRMVRSSDLASIYVHGSQEKIGQLFAEARKAAPVILNFEEFEALVPKRGSRGSEHQAGEVNEFLAQMNNCGRDGIFIIASTNRPDMIDPAVKRRGRIDFEVCVPMPDAAARRGIFAVHLKGRPCADDIDTERLASLTDGYTASDIAFIAGEASMRIFDTGRSITQAILEEVIAATSPSYTETRRPTVGFKTNP